MASRRAFGNDPAIKNLQEGDIRRFNKENAEFFASIHLQKLVFRRDFLESSNGQIEFSNRPWTWESSEAEKKGMVQDILSSVIQNRGAIKNSGSVLSSDIGIDDQRATLNWQIIYILDSDTNEVTHRSLFIDDNGG